MSEGYRIEITPNGLKFEGVDFKDAKCLSELEKILKSLEEIGIKVDLTEQKRKAESYVAAKQEQTKQVKY